MFISEINVWRSYMKTQNCKINMIMADISKIDGLFMCVIELIWIIDSLTIIWFMNICMPAFCGLVFYQ